VLRQLAETVRDSGEVPSKEDLNRLADEEFYVPFASLQGWQTMRKAAKRLVNSYVDHYSTDLHRIWAVERPFALLKEKCLALLGHFEPERAVA
jgi:hypothetical protein